MSEIIKLTYRGLGGFIIIVLMFSLAVSGIAVAFAGVALAVLSWLPFVFPEFLDQVTVTFFVPVTDPTAAFFVFLLTGILLIGIGALLLTVTFYIGKAAIVIDRELGSMVDKAVDKPPTQIFYLTGSPQEQLNQLQTLYEEDKITQQEFKAEKANILAELKSK